MTIGIYCYLSTVINFSWLARFYCKSFSAAYRM
jgi:hypothetical protein